MGDRAPASEIENKCCEKNKNKNKEFEFELVLYLYLYCHYNILLRNTGNKERRNKNILNNMGVRVEK
jgi:hypothetical protein